MTDKLCTEQKTFKDNSPTTKKKIVTHPIISPNSVRRGGKKVISLKTCEAGQRKISKQNFYLHLTAENFPMASRHKHLWATTQLFSYTVH